MWENAHQREGTHHRAGAPQTNTSCFLTDLAAPAPPSKMQTITGGRLLSALPEREYGAMGEGHTPAKPGFRASLCHLATVEFSFNRSSARSFLPDYRITQALPPLLNDTNAQAFPAILQIWALNTVLLRENFLRSSSLIQTYIHICAPSAVCVYGPSSCWFTVLWYFMHLTPASTNSFKGLYLTKILQSPFVLEGWCQELAGSQFDICWWWLTCQKRVFYEIIY